MRASAHGDLDAIKALVASGVDIDFVSAASETALTYAIVWNQLESAKLLLEKGASVETPPEPSWSPLMYAANEGNTAIVELLLDHGAVKERRDEHGRTAATLARDRGFSRIGQLCERPETPLWLWVLILIGSCVFLVQEIVHPITALSWPIRTGSGAAGVAIGLATPVTRVKNGMTLFIYMFVGFVLLLVLHWVAPLVFEAVYLATLSMAFGAALGAILQTWRRPQARIE